MMKVYIRRLVLICLSLGGMQLLPAQDYLKALNDADKYFGQRISHFSNGDVLVGNSSVEALRTGGGGTVYLTRLDVCGNTSWSLAYHRDEEYMEIKDVIVNEADEIFAYGSAYIGLDELIFLLKVDGKGHILKFQLFEPETVDHFSYSIDLKDGLLMAYGLILDFNTKKYGFIAVFNESLSFRWGVKFTPFESVGDARITNSGGFLCRSGPFLIKLSPEGQWEWGKQLDEGMQQIPIAGPLEVNDGYVLEVFGSGHAFFCKIDMQGRLVWTSDQFPSKASGADMDILPDGKIIATYSTDNGIEGHLCYLILSEQGQILERRALQTTPPTDPGQTYQTTVRKDRRVIAVNPDRFKPGTTPLPAFLLQISWPPVTGDCTEWVSLPETELLSPVGNLQFVPLDTVTTATVMTPIGSTIIMSHEFPTPYREACVDGPETGVIRIDSLLSCTEDWLVDLPGPDYVWTDGHPEYSRLLTESGTYQARNEDCGNVSLYEYILTRENCPCSIYIPTAFSPNNDGYNDLLQCYAGCELSDLRIRIFNRWGVLVFDGLSPAAAWDGTYRGSPSDSGIYIILVNYFWRNEAGTVQQATVSQELTLIR